MQTDLDERVRKKLNEVKGYWPAVAILSGVSHSWITKFMTNRIASPGIVPLRKLRNVLQLPKPKLLRKLQRISEQK